MTILLSLLLFLSLVGNGLLIWYTRKLVQNLYYGVNNIDELQKLLNEYVSLLEPLANMENYYGDPALSSAVANTKLVIDACRVYKKTIIENYDEENQNEEAEEVDETVGQENGQNNQEQKTGQAQTQQTPQTRRKAEATIGPIGS